MKRLLRHRFGEQRGETKKSTQCNKRLLSSPTVYKERPGALRRVRQVAGGHYPPTKLESSRSNRAPHYLSSAPTKLGQCCEEIDGPTLKSFDFLGAQRPGI
ncbi:hypothetical protein T265_01777 [Opisthorchis viverrini]|uniref:Uncharacterized protein n=1 Tax=Opisthorchis viverrini TaxID=6198 RepID=A0A074ZYP5_OPIVI|nr:hypothetical protein T265_01777 [Opisthorchis viverrini]KER32161.1 hypothetical protein T265_01777 [Opisthorchis viverrini]